MSGDKMARLKDLPKEKLIQLETELKARYSKFVEKRLNLDMTRGKPAANQLDLANGLFSALSEDDFKDKSGFDCRNYGILDGIPEAKNLFSQILGVSNKEIIIGGNASLNLMHDTIVRALLHGTSDSDKPWEQGKIKFLCPAPGYDRHFAICEHYDIEMISIPLNEDGPDMDLVEKLVKEDEDIKGIWCVPKFSNPTGIIYSDETIKRLATMPTKAEDFRIFCDNAYAIHFLEEPLPKQKNFLEACKEAGNPNRVYLFGSTSKISFPGSGIAFLGGSVENIEYIKKHMGVQTIGYNKLNMLRHLRFFKNFEGIIDHMRKHAQILKPKFDTILEVLSYELDGKDIATWTRPKGGYFISLDTLPNCAKSVVSMAEKAGVKLTKAGATYPYGKDPEDRNIRIAPSLPPLEEIKEAIEILAICVQLVSIEKLLDR